jgi:phosphoribosylformylglycinamidine cyclo-ligase
MAQVSISGGEIAQLRDVIRGFDLVGMAVGRVDLKRVIDGRDIAPGDVIIGVKSNGLHSNGYSLARRVLFEIGRFRIDQKLDELGTTLGEELLRPTSIYVRDAMEILENVRGVKALFNITGDGLLNLTRAAAAVGYEIDKPIEPQPIFGLIQRYGEVSDAEMFEVFNMGTGFCYVVAPAAVDATLAILKKHGRDARPIGHAVADQEKKVSIPAHNLVGQGKKFRIEAGGRSVR